MQNLENLISQCGVQLYDVEVANENGRAIYRIYIAKPDGVNLDDCEKVSRLLSPIFDVEPPLSGDYVLEVSSPGLERKLEKPSHFISSVGIGVFLWITLTKKEQPITMLLPHRPLLSESTRRRTSKIPAPS